MTRTLTLVAAVAALAIFGFVIILGMPAEKRSASPHAQIIIVSYHAGGVAHHRSVRRVAH